MNAEEVLYEARKALYVMVGFIALIWAVQVVNWARTTSSSAHYGIVPRTVAHLGDIFSSPFLHCELAAHRGQLRAAVHVRVPGRLPRASASS